MLVLTAMVTLPFGWILQKFWRPSPVLVRPFFGMSVNFDKVPTQTQALIEQLNVQTLLVRFPMWELSRIDEYRAWIDTFSKYHIVLNVIQDPTRSPQELREAFTRIFDTFAPSVQTFQIGTTINRAKWGFYSIRDYLKFYQVAYDVAHSHDVAIELIGPSMIDFEYYYTTQALFNFFPLRFDATSALLYVDRSGSPENTQFGFDLIGKIDLLYSLVRLSPKTGNRIIITETNWPLENSGKYAPTSPKECVSEEEFANYMVRYYLLALASGKVEAVYWHQLIAVGFGLVDPRDMRKRAAFYAFKTMLEELQGATIQGLVRHKVYFELRYDDKTVLWTNDVTYDLDKKASYRDRDGAWFENVPLRLSGRPIYVRGVA